jgi:hypothetical protein
MGKYAKSCTLASWAIERTGSLWNARRYTFFSTIEAEIKDELTVL